MKVGVLALQGGYQAHARMLQHIGIEAINVRESNDFTELEGLILPGGESSTQLKLIDRFSLKAPLQQFAQSGKPIFGTCAGLILTAKRVHDPIQSSLEWLDVDVQRNGWGRQLDSFEAMADDGQTPLCFIRAPRITRVGRSVEVLATYRQEPILVREKNIVGATFHPELRDHTLLYQQIFKNAHHRLKNNKDRKTLLTNTVSASSPKP